ncbi:MAG: exodeoxyribonuclease VII large subunit [Desulfotomaculales bacterium]
MEKGLPAQKRLLTVTELTLYIKEVMERDPLLVNLWVKGEISNCRSVASGHLYFTLKDDQCSLKAVMFRSRFARLPFQPKNGLAVRVRGYVTVFGRDGTYQMYVEEMEPEGTGALYLAFEQLKKRLQQEGLFDPRHKKKLPFLPRRVGIVTSPTGAVIRDMVKIINRRWPGVQIVLAPVSVQGDSAAAEIARAIALLNRAGNVDVIIAGRGGGSLEELWAFNTEEVAYSIFHSAVPVISAVGHETDYTIADFVADVRAPTPSAAAELVVPVKTEVKKYLQNTVERLCRAAAEKINQLRRRLEAVLGSPLFTRPAEEICERRQQAVDFLVQQMGQAINLVFEQNRHRLAVLAGRLEVLSPLVTLARGYSICTKHRTNELVINAQDVGEGEAVQVRLHQGKLICLVEERVTGEIGWK